MRRIVPVVTVLVLVAARPAHADLGSSLYDDVRDVVEELIQTEVTTSVVRTIEDRSPALAFYMRGTLERLGSPYWGSLGRALKDDLTVVVSDFVYWHLSTGGGDGDVVASARRFFGCMTGIGDANNSDACKRMAAAIHDQHRPLLEVECRRAKPPAERRVACDVGLAVLAALEHTSAVRHHVVDALGDIVLSELGDGGTSDRLRDVLTHWLDLPKDLPSTLLEAAGDTSIKDLLDTKKTDELCTDPKLVDSILHDASSAGWICFAVSHSALKPKLAAKVTIKDGDHTLDLVVDYWLIAAALHDWNADTATDDSSFRLLADAAFDLKCPAGNTIAEWPCKGTRLGPGSTITVEWLGRSLTGTADAGGTFATKPNHGMMLWLLRFRKALKRIDELRAAVPAPLQSYLFFPGSEPLESRKVLRSIARMARLVGELRGRWYLWTQSSQNTSELELAELLRVARDAVGDAAPMDLGFLDKTATGGASSIDIGDWLRLVMRGDYRSLAMESLRAALDLPLGATNRPRETFFLTLASYLLDTGEGVNEAVARSAFKAAAKDLLLSQSHRGVPRAGDRWRFRLLPRLSIRLSFNDEYAKTDGDTRRNVVAADWPTAMFAISDYVGLEASVIDPVAPLAEMALRPAGTYRGYPNVALDAIRPRLGVWVAVPQLSRRLSLSIGFGARFLALEPEMGPTPITMRYHEHASLTFDAGVQLVF